MGRPESETPLEVARLPTGDPFIFEDVDVEGPPAYEESIVSSVPRDDDEETATQIGDLSIRGEQSYHHHWELRTGLKTADEKREARAEVRRRHVSSRSSREVVSALSRSGLITGG
jgi:hypothetical protein